MTTDTRVRQFDPNFQLPEELQFAVYDEQTPNALVGDDSEGFEGDGNDVIIIDTDENSELPEDEASDTLSVPGAISIVSQTVRTAPDGRQVVDVILSVEDVYGAVKYDVRVTKT